MTLPVEECAFSDTGYLAHGVSTTYTPASPLEWLPKTAGHAVLIVACLATSSAMSQDASWLANPGSAEWTTATNWTPAAVPTGTAIFGPSSISSLTVAGDSSIGTLQFNAGAPAYSVLLGAGVSLTITGSGILNNSSFAPTITLGGAGPFGPGLINFTNASIAGNAILAGNAIFFDRSNAANATINGGATFIGSSSAGAATINGGADFNDDSSAGNAHLAILNGRASVFLDRSTAGDAVITNATGGLVRFGYSATAANATITNDSGATLRFTDASTAGSARVINNGDMLLGEDVRGLGENSTAGSASITNNSNLSFIRGSTAGTATISTGDAGITSFQDTSSAGSASMTNAGRLQFSDNSSAANSAIVNTADFSNGQFVVFSGNSTAAGATIITRAGAATGFAQSANGGSARFITDASGLVDISGLTTAGTTAGSIEGEGTYFLGSKQLTVGSNGLSTTVSGVISDGGAAGGGGGSLAKVGSGTLTLTGINTYTGATSVTGGVLEISGSIAQTSSVTAGSGGFLQLDNGLALGGAQATLSGGTLRANFTGSLANTIDFAAATTSSLTAASGTQLTFTGGYILGNGATAQFGSASDTGTIRFEASGGTVDPTAQVAVSGGRLMVDGSLAGAALTTVNAGAVLGGSGTIGNTLVAAGGVLAPGPLGASGALTIAGNLAFQSGGLYQVLLTPGAASTAAVSGTASLTGGVLQVGLTAGSYVARQYTILSAAGGVTGTFATDGGATSGFTETLNYTPNEVLLNLTASLGNSASLNQNQQAVATTINGFFNQGGALPSSFLGLFGLERGGLGNALSQLSGEIGTAPQQTTFDAMSQFLGVMTDPFMAGRGDPIAAGGSPSNAFGTESPAYAARGTECSPQYRDTCAAVDIKALVAPSFEQRWSVWTAGFGGSQQTDGSTTAGSNTATSNLYASAVGADYRIWRETLVGFAIAGGGTNFSVANNLGGGRSDLFQAGAFFRHSAGPAYITGAFGYGWQDIVTDRTVTVGGINRLRAEFNANAYSGRLEGGYRFATQGVGLAPYAAAQSTTFDLPAYAEQTIVGSNGLALAYSAKSVTDIRSELGVRTDKAFGQADGILTLRGRVAWAHDYTPERALGVTFQALPGASFVLNGAAMPANSALVTASAEKKWLNGWSAAATLEGEFSNVTRSYVGKAVVRYAW
ncbi:autotransporter outer membrane beta-barrel domain-containing protein [Bradyrhizobium guangzhouense]|uniref:autotransporter outer membrane beta-barrel domain-containing protein n=1 Tax=Bradyrhizobium guangzhouense TaxID=1325095 RepID=UPI0013E8E581|nr:autotransporter domain-containing protein [Bradyrhizobium guangzhouense]